MGPVQSMGQVPGAGPRQSVVVPGALHIQLEGASGLRDADFLPGAGKSDPYAVVEIQGKRNTRFQTDVINNTQDPMWNIEADVPGYEPGDNVVVTIYDKDPMPGKSDDVLGHVVLTSDQFAGGLQGDVRLDKGGKGGQDAFVTLAIQPPTAVVTAPPQYVQAGQQMVQYGSTPVGTMMGTPVANG